jgi:hypothetical protein
LIIKSRKKIINGINPARYPPALPKGKQLGGVQLNTRLTDFFGIKKKFGQGSVGQGTSDSGSEGRGFESW